MAFEAFRVIAQIAAGLVGFVGIILVLQHRLRVLPPRQLTGFLQSSVGALAFALMPDLVFSTPVAKDLGWQILGGVFGVYHLFIYIYFLAGYPDLRRMPGLQALITLASIPVIAAKLVLGFGYLIDHAVSLYHLGLLWLIMISIFFFVQVLTNETALTSNEASER